MPFYLAWIYSNFSHWNFKFFSISDLSYGTNQNFMPLIQAQFFVARYPQKLHSVIGRPSSSQEEEDYGFDEFGFERTASIEDSNIAIIYGIVSFGPKKCGIPGVLGVYTRVTKYLTWIFGHMKGKQYDIVLCLIFCACQYIQLIPILSNHTLFCPVKSKSSPVQPEQPLWTLFTVLLYNRFCAAKGKLTNFILILHTN